MSGSAGALVCGVDEAGLGPILGPLAIGWSAVRVPEPGGCPWKLLRRRVGRLPKHDVRRTVVADSKVVFARNPRGRKRLERTALSFLALLDDELRAPREAGQVLFGTLGPDPSLLARHPWYGALPDVPRELEAEAVELNAALLRREMDRSGCALVDAGVRLVPAGELNDSYHETGSKAATLWGKTLEVLRHLWRVHGAEGPQVVVDLQGARTHYGPLLARAFPDASVRLVREEPLRAEYELVERSPLPGLGRGRRMELAFLARAEEHSFAVALASCLAKYSRELAMEAFNAWWALRRPDLRPTAGYTTDGRRWLREAGAVVRDAHLPDGVLVRER